MAMPGAFHPRRVFLRAGDLAGIATVGYSDVNESNKEGGQKWILGATLGKRVRSPVTNGHSRKPESFEYPDQDKQ
jgi:hypothetical protein